MPSYSVPKSKITEFVPFFEKLKENLERRVPESTVEFPVLNGNFNTAAHKLRGALVCCVNYEEYKAYHFLKDKYRFRVLGIKVYAELKDFNTQQLLEQLQVSVKDIKDHTISLSVAPTLYTIINSIMQHNTVDSISFVYPGIVKCFEEAELKKLDRFSENAKYTYNMTDNILTFTKIPLPKEDANREV